MLCVGIDFGTSNSSAAVYDGSVIRLLPLDHEGSDPCVMRSLVYIERSGDVWFGQTALSRYLEQNTGRAVRYERQRVGEVTMVFAEIGTMVQEALALIDVSEPGRLFQSLKRFLSVTSFRATNVFGLNYTIEELLSLLARELLSRIQVALGHPFTSLSVGWPVRFSEDPAADTLARRRLREAWRLAGVEDVTFVEEPVAAIRHFAIRIGTILETPGTSSCSTSAAARWTSASPGCPAVACRRWRHEGWRSAATSWTVASLRRS
jgi:hypothetical chaperone protein